MPVDLFPGAAAWPGWLVWPGLAVIVAAVCWVAWWLIQAPHHDDPAPGHLDEWDTPREPADDLDHFLACLPEDLTEQQRADAVADWFRSHDEWRTR